MKKLLSAILVALLLLAGGCKEKVKEGSIEVKRQRVSGVAVAKIVPAPVEEFYQTSGTIRANAVSVLASRVMGTVIAVKVREGDRVSPGQVLIILDDRDSLQRVTAAEKAVEAARQNQLLMEATYQRYKRLHDEKALTPQEMDQIETQKKVAGIEYERAVAGLAEAKIYHGFTRISAPFAGVVTEKKIDAGSMAVPGAPLLTVEDNSSFRLEVNVDQGMSGKIRTGMPVKVVMDAPSKGVEGSISEIVPAVDPLSRTFLVKVALKGQGLRSGSYARANIPAGKKEKLLIPKQAIIEKGQLTGVYTVDSRNVIMYRLVRTGKEYGDDLEILSGLTPRERVITAGIEKAVDGGVVDGPPSPLQGQ